MRDKKVSNLNYLLTSYGISLTGDWLYKFALPLLIYKESQSPLLMAIAYGITYIPNILFTIVGGAFADIYEKKSVLIIGDITAALFSFLLFTVYFWGFDSIPLTLLFVLLISTASAFYYPAHQAIIPELVDEDDLVGANAKMRSVDSTFLILGPTLSAVIISLISIEWALLLNGVSFILSSVLISRINLKQNLEVSDEVEPTNLQSSYKNVKEKIIEGLKLTYSLNQLKHACVLFIMINIAISIYYSNLIFIVKSQLQASDYELGILYSIVGVGAFLGSMTSKSIIHKLGEATTIVYAVFASTFFFFLLFFAYNIWLTAVIWSCVTFCNSSIIVSYFTLRQKIVPRKNLATVVAVTRSIVILCIPIGSLIGGLVLDYSKEAYALIALALILMIASSLYAVFSPFNRSVYVRCSENQ